MKFALIGGGNMGRALVSSWLRSGVRSEDITVADVSEEARAGLAREFGVKATAAAIDALDGAAVAVLAVKPQDMAGTLAPLRAALVAQNPLVISIAAGIRLADLGIWCGENAAVVRAMPNRPALVGAGATGVFAPDTVSAESRALAEIVLRPTGIVVWVEREDALDAVTALSGSGPAYFFLLAEAMVDSARALGLPADAARQLALATLHGAGMLAAQSDADLALLRAEVTSKGGTTETAVRVMQEQGLGAIVAQAMAAARRSSSGGLASLARNSGSEK